MKRSTRKFASTARCPAAAAVCVARSIEGSVSVASTASAASDSEQYDDDFDDYSDSFESDNDGTNPDAPVVLAASGSTEQGLLHVGTRVQVFWREENDWFDGEIQRVEVGNEPRCYVHYVDGEQQWEDPSNIRPLPADITSVDEYDQLQQLLPLGTQRAQAIIGQRAMVYWQDEAEWYSGVVSAAQASPPALKIEYDDGDSRWEQERVFNCILLQQKEVEAPKPSSSTADPPLSSSTPLSPPQRVLYARPYRQAVSDHFQPVRFARPYRCAVEKHTKSVITPRISYSERRYLHVVHDALECFHCDQHIAPESMHIDKVDSIVQTTLPSCLTESSSLH